MEYDAQERLRGGGEEWSPIGIIDIALAIYLVVN
jgi:hypothetical protein